MNIKQKTYKETVSFYTSDYKLQRVKFSATRNQQQSGANTNNSLTALSNDPQETATQSINCISTDIEQPENVDIHIKMHENDIEKLNLQENRAENGLFFNLLKVYNRKKTNIWEYLENFVCFFIIPVFFICDVSLEMIYGGQINSKKPVIFIFYLMSLLFKFSAIQNSDGKIDEATYSILTLTFTFFFWASVIAYICVLIVW
ncbi:hypothetical protein EDEG_03420 [Edhazardia aedis USNM 41457]|uniref:Uncharacterized protein n=1 Tax=Edhazardia aedis (strain USNM 41457) TaxID=1003232 RepID=J9D3M3_EDHAE|nr:hypothetical protein EDEG_03420 [Edhazardia aedis USNM 41457]|eukprot:EJW02139.1 hypothetical protein EDEG_03420 [Edhazardia aedis USNM 41457]